MKSVSHTAPYRTNDVAECAGPSLCHNPSKCQTVFDHVASTTTRLAGSPFAFMAALFAVLAWAMAGPFFGYSETWQLVINTATTIVTFLMVFLIQQTQNKDSEAIHLKLNELLVANRHASNRLIGVEKLDEQHLRAMAEFYRDLAARHALDEEKEVFPENLQKNSQRPMNTSAISYSFYSEYIAD